jgi:hypothetical protein
MVKKLSKISKVSSIKIGLSLKIKVHGGTEPVRKMALLLT